MKCIHCFTDVKFKEREDGKCKSCKHPLAFSPSKGDLFTDIFFQSAINKVSSNGTVYWTANHLKEALRFWKLHPWNRITGSIQIPDREVPWGKYIFRAVFLLGISIYWAGMATWILLLLIIIVTIIAHLPTYQNPNFCNDEIYDRQFSRHFKIWQETHGIPEKLIVRQPFVKPLLGAEADLTDYSFDRAVIVDCVDTADILIANNFHFENNCAVLAFSGYPANIFKTVLAMLRRNPKLLVFSLHDATVSGCQQSYRLAKDPEWFKDGAKIIDIGLRPAQIGFFRFLSKQESFQVSEGMGITKIEARWLSNHFAKLTTLTPDQIIKNLYREMTTVNTSEINEEGLYYLALGLGVLATNSGWSEGGADSFG